MIFTSFILPFFLVLVSLYGESGLSLAWDTKDLISSSAAK